MLLAGSDNLSQSSASSLGSWENISTSQLVRLASTQGVELLFMGKLGSWETIWTSQPVRTLGKSELLSMGEEDSRSYCQGLIGHDAPVMSRVRHGHSGYGNGYGGLEGHRKEDVISKVSDPPFTNFD